MFIRHQLDWLEFIGQVWSECPSRKIASRLLSKIQPMWCVLVFLFGFSKRGLRRAPPGSIADLIRTCPDEFEPWKKCRQISPWKSHDIFYHPFPRNRLRPTCRRGEVETNLGRVRHESAHVEFMTVNEWIFRESSESLCCTSWTLFHACGHFKLRSSTRNVFHIWHGAQPWSGTCSLPCYIWYYNVLHVCVLSTNFSPH